MRVVALISGGKDSTFNMMQCVAAGHEIAALANLSPQGGTEIDSYMYQSVGFEAIDLIAQAMELPLFRTETSGTSLQKGRTYEPADDKDEVEDLFNLLKVVKEQVDIQAVSVGAILSDYQRVRVENVCIRLGLTPLAYLWQRDQAELLDEMIKCEVDAIIIKVAALGLETKHLGRTLSLMQPHLHAMHEKYGLNVCGEGGEYETLTLDCPLFKSRLRVENSEVVIHSDDSIAPVAYLKFNKLKLETKLPALDLNSRLKDLPLKDSDGYVTDQGEDVIANTDLTNDEIDNSDGNSNNSPVERSFIQQDSTSVESSDGWVFVGGIQSQLEDPALAMQEVMSVLKCKLADHNQNVRDVCSLTMFISDMNQYAELNKLYVETMNHVNPPARACVQVPFDSKCPVAMDVVSWRQPEISGNNSSGDAPIERTTMHVQSRSHWAPANIGPYSQSVRVGDIINLAGQIGLVPGSLEMVQGGIKSQCQLTLRHISRLLKAVDSNVNLRDVVQGICYVTNAAFVEPCRKIWEGKTNNAIVDYIVITGLPRNALVEWHVWAHRHNNQFEYEETGMCIEDYSVSIFRRWNYENNLSAIVCHVDRSDKLDQEVDAHVFVETVDYVLKKLQQGHENVGKSIFKVKVFYLVSKKIDATYLVDYLNSLRINTRLVYTVVPVVALKSQHTVLSMCGVRYQ